ncbi:MAG: hypothetical protein KDD55_07715 [Bdellovibrionales bacterium]|nr:hypothetical protein [Bdellovibrionales bacterium]
MKARIYLFLECLFALLGGALLLLTFTGTILSPVSSIDTYRTPENPAHYYERTLEPQEAYATFHGTLSRKEALSDEAPYRLFTLIKDSYVHTSSYRLTIFDNWLLWLKAHLTPTQLRKELLLDTQLAELLWKRGGGYCHQAVWIFVKHARELGFEANFVRLNGHYVGEVKLKDGSWKTVDPDLGIWWDERYDEHKPAFSKEKVIAALESTGFSKARAEHLSKMYSGEARRGLFYSTPELIEEEYAAERYKWIIPFAFLVIALLIHWTRKKLRKGA